MLYMETATEMKGGEMTYTMRLDHADGTFEIMNLDADSYESAKSQARQLTDAEFISVIGTRSWEPQEFLAW